MKLSSLNRMHLVVAAVLTAKIVTADVFNMGPGLTNLEMVTVGNPGNTNDMRTADDGTSGYGAVPYLYQIGKYEVTAGQYTAFLNSVAATDTYGLYNPLMSSSPYGCQILQSGVSGSLTYSVAPDRANRPVNCVTFWGTCRFTNWLNNGQPTGQQNASTTEDGAYTLNGYVGNDGRTIARNTSAKYLISSENEWYKAAYYDPNKGGSGVGGYWTYATKSDTIPTSEAPPGNDLVHGSANHAFNSPLAVGAPYYTTPVGAYMATSAYGTFDQTGNVNEWNDTVVVLPGQTSSPSRGCRGGSFAADDYNHLTALNHISPCNPSGAGGDITQIGFRIGSYDALNSIANSNWNASSTWDHGMETPSASRFVSVQNYTVTVNGNGNAYRLLINNLGKVIISNDSIMTVTELMQIGMGGVLAGNGMVVTGTGVKNQGEIRVDKTQSMVISGGGSTGNINGGRVSIIQGGIEFTQGLTNQTTGKLDVRDSILRFGAGLVNQGSLNVSFGTTDVFGPISNNATGKIILSGNSNTTFWDNVSNEGTIKVSAGSTAVFFGTLTGSTTGIGTVFIEGGTDSMAGASLLLAGNDSSLSNAAVNIQNDSAIGLTVSGVLTVGALTGLGNTYVVGSGVLNAASIQQDTLSIGGSSPATAVPEPSSLLLLAVSAAALIYFWRRR